MNCEQVQLLLAEFVLEPIRDPGVDWDAVAAHLDICSACAEECEQIRQTIAMVRSLPEDLAEQALAGELDVEQLGIERESVTSVPLPLPMTEASGSASVENWAQLHSWISNDAEQKRQARKARVFQLFHRAGALAACVALCVFAGSLLYQRRVPETPAGSAVQPIPATDAAHSIVMGTVVRLEANTRCTDAGMDEPQRVVAGETLAAKAGERLQLRIWDRHDVTIEPNTTLTANRSTDGGCALVLSSGQITASVNRTKREGLFRVTTPQAELTVTGTVFTVSSTPTDTQLRVCEGAVQLKAQHGSTQLVSAGQTYSTDGTSMVKVDSPSAELPDALANVIDRATDEVGSLINSPWYRERFAPLVHLGEYLRDQGMDADDMTLLAISADLWCLQYPKDPTANLPPYIHRQAGLERAAKFYGHKVEWPTPANEKEAIQWVQRAASAGDLVLAFSEKDQTVGVVNRKDSANLSVVDSRSYRFLGQEKEVVSYGLAKISRSTKPETVRAQLAREAVADMRQLLTKTHDSTYWVGQQAVQTWAKHFVKSQSEAMPGDPLLQSVSAIARLAVPCQKRHASWGMTTDVARWQAACRALDNHAIGPQRSTDRGSYV